MTLNAFQAHQDPLLTESDMITRIRDLLAPAANPAQLWVLLLDGLRRQTPVMLPIEHFPALPDAELLKALGTVLATTMEQSLHGRGSVIFVRERLGTDSVTQADRRWARGLAGASDHAGIPVTGVFLLSPHRVRPIHLH